MKQNQIETFFFSVYIPLYLKLDDFGITACSMTGTISSSVEKSAKCAL